MNRKTVISTIALLWVCFFSVSGQTAVPDTIFIYETVTLYDTIVIHDTIRVKRKMNIPMLQPRDIVHVSLNENKILLLPATFSENSIIQEKENHPSKNKKEMRIFNLDIARYVSATILTAHTMSGISAQEIKPAEDMMTLPMQMSIVYPMTTQGNQTVNYRYHLSFNLFSGRVGAVKGVEFGTLFNHVEHDVKGVQFVGLANKTHEIAGIQFGGLANMTNDVTGVQFAGLANVSRTVKGIQFGGLTNITESANGIQFGGIVNFCKEMTGIQFSGIANLSEHTKGVQFAGIANMTEKSEGLQFGGIGNVSKEVSGVSFGGVFNRTGTLRGVQFAGIVNVIDTIGSGASIALINIVKKGFYHAWELSLADYMNVGVSFKMGTQKFYTIFSAGGTFLEDQLWLAGFGLGNRTALSPRVDFQPEIVGYQYFPWDFRNVRNTSFTHLKFGFVFKLNDRLGLVVAPSVYYFYAEAEENGKYMKTSPVAPFYEKYRAESYGDRGIISSRIPSHVFGFGGGISIGLLFRN